MADEEIFRGSMQGSLIHIKHLGFKPRTVIDVGAALGTFELYEIFPESKHILIEPISDNEPYLAQICKKLGNAEYIIAAATREPGIVKLNVHPALVHSDITDQQAVSDKNLSIRTILGVTLDQICTERQLDAPYLIKIDVDGKEVDVLAGATQTLKYTEYVIIEATLYGQIYDVMDFMRAQGFVAYDIVDLAWRPSDKALWQCNMAFVKETGQFRKSSSFINSEQTEGLDAHLKAYRERCIAYIKQNYSNENQADLKKEFRLRDINMVCFPDWSQPEDLLVQDLLNLLRVVATHPDKNHMTLLLDTSNIDAADADVALSGAVMHLLAEENIEISEEELEITLLGKLSETHWQSLLPYLSTRIILEHENQLAIAQAEVKNIPACKLNSFKDKRVVQLETGTWNLN